MKEIINKINLLIGEKERKSFTLLLMAVFLLGFLEMITVASIFPFMAVILDPNILESNEIIGYFVKVFNINGTEYLIVILGAIVSMLFIISNALSVLLIWWTNKFIYMLGHRVSIKVLTNYTRLPYAFFIQQNVSELSKNILVEVRRVVVGIILPSTVLVTRIVVVFFMMILLIIANPKVTLIIFSLLFIIYFCMYYFVRGKAKYIGEKVTASNGDRFRMADECINSIALMKITQVSKVFINRFSKPSFINAENNAKSRLLEVAPRYVVETFAFVIIILFILHSLNSGLGSSEILPLMTMFILAAYRLLPSVQQIYLSIIKIRFNSSALDILLRDYCPINFEVKDIDDGDAISLDKSICFRNVSFKYPLSNRYALDNVNIRIDKNTTVGIVGETGSGKSTFLNVLLGLLEHDSGEILIDDEKCDKIDPRMWHKIVGYVPQSTYLIDDTITKNIAFGIADEKVDHDKVRNVAKIALIDDYIQTLELGYSSVVGDRGIKLSGGEKQRVGLARALYNNPKLLILDEATSSLDKKTERLISESISNISGEITIVIVAHRFSTLIDCDVIHNFNKGTLIYSGSYDDFLSTDKKV